MEAARLRGSVIGRPRKLTLAQINSIRILRQQQPCIKLPDIAAQYGVRKEPLREY